VTETASGPLSGKKLGWTSMPTTVKIDGIKNDFNAYLSPSSSKRGPGAKMMRMGQAFVQPNMLATTAYITK
jgi:hypothetical protein